MASSLRRAYAHLGNRARLAHWRHSPPVTEQNSSLKPASATHYTLDPSRRSAGDCLTKEGDHLCRNDGEKNDHFRECAKPIYQPHMGQL